MNVVIITQDDPFYLGRSIDYLLSVLPPTIEVKACVVFEVSPFGKRESFVDKIKRTYQVFGLSFVIRYGIKYLQSKLHRTSQVKKVLAKHQVPIVELEKRINHPDSLKIINEFAPDVLVSIAGNQIFKKPLIELAPKGCINLHTALLPKYRGLMPTFWVLLNEEKYTGVSVFYVDEGIDSGPILVQKKVEIGGKNQAQLIRETKKLGMEAISEALQKIEKGNPETIPNPEEEMTYYSFPTREDVREFKKKGRRFY